MNDTGATVFVIDDDASMREALKNLLRSVGFDVVTFGTAREFLSSRCSEMHGCVIVDVRLPGVSGLDLQRQLAVGSSRVDLQACKLEYSIVSPK